MRYLQNLFAAAPAPQSRPMPGQAGQVPNSAGGYVWAVDHWKRLERFLILGSEDGTYYIEERALTLENANAVAAALREDGSRVVAAIVEIAAAGRAPRHDPALFALAMAASPKFADARANALALAALPRVARTGTHLCHFAAYVDALRGWGRALRTAVGDWYLEKPARDLAYQMLKYQQRDGWAHRDLLRLAHPKPATPAQNALFRWAVEGEISRYAPIELITGDLSQIHAYELARKAGDEREIVRLIEDYRLTHEMIPPQWKNSPPVWDALLESMPYTAMLRQLGKLTAIGLIAPHSEAAAVVAARLASRGRIRNAKVHPIAVLSALMAYRGGRGVKGSLTWAPVAGIIDALDEAFYQAFDNVAPTGRRLYVGLDASGSMQGAAVFGMPHMTAAMASAAMAMVFARTEPYVTVAAFHDRIWHVNLTRRDRLDRACDAIAREARATDASLPMKDALDRRLSVDAFVLMTDSETWAGDRHPAQALDEYRQATGIPARLVVVAMAANRYTIADPNDAGQMDVAGFDASVPGVVADFAA